MKIYSYIVLLFLGLTGGVSPVFAQTIGVSFPDSTVREGHSFVMPLHVDSSLTADSILSYQVQVRFSNTNLRLDSVSTAATLSDNWQVTVNDRVGSSDRELTIAGAGTTPLSDTGSLVNLYLTALRSGTNYIQFTGTENNYLNEGTPELTFNHGYVSVNALPSLNFSPSSDLLTRGDQQEFNVSGGTEPYQWSLTDPSVGAIDADGLFTAENTGFTRVIAEDAKGIVDTTSGEIEVRGFKLFAKDTSEYQGLEVVMPVHVSDLSELDITSGSFTMRLSDRQFTVTELIKTGTLLETGSEVEWNRVNGGVHIGFATSQALSGAGVLLYARLEIASDDYGYNNIYFDEILFNESLTGNYETRSFTVNDLPPLEVTPMSAELLRGDSLQFQVSNHTGPVSWSVSNPQKARIETNGWFYAEEGGTLTVTAIDSIGSTQTSDPITIYDVDVTIPDTAGLVAETLLVPVRVSNLPAVESISSIEGELNFNENYLVATGVETSSSMSDGWSFSAHRPASGTLSFAGAGSGGLNADGVLFYVSVVLDLDLSYKRTAYLNFNQLVINEGRPSARTTDGSIEISVAVEAPLPGYPSSGATNVPIDTVFEWLSVSGAVEYQMQLSTVNNFSTVLIDSSGLAGSSASISGLSTSVTYYWRVRGYSSSGVSGAWSSVYSFSTVDFVNTPPYIAHTVSDQMLQEDFSPFVVASLDTVFEEPDAGEGDTLAFSLEMMPSGVIEGNIENKQLNMSAVPDSLGIVQVIVKASDIYNASAADTFVVTVQPVNDLPVWSLPQDTLRFKNDSVVVVDIWSHVNDVETAVENMSYTFNASESAIQASFDGATGSLAIEAPGFAGDAQLVVEATDADQGTARDTLYMSVTLSTRLAESEVMPSAFALHSNYPNPFNPSTNIRYDVPKGVHVRLSVYNMSGQKVATLVNQYQSPGNYQVTFEAGGLSSGIYLVQLQADRFQQVRKMMLVK